VLRILGISAFYHDSAAALIANGQVIAAAQEERFTRKKHDPDFPHHAVAYCLEEGGCNLDGVDYVVFYEKPLLKFERLVETHLAMAPRSFLPFAQSMPLWTRQKVFHRTVIERALRPWAQGFDFTNRLLFSQHHLSHVASAFFASPFSEALLLTLDGVGEWATTAVALAKGNQIEMLREIQFPHSLGLLYSAFTQYLGFKVNSGEYKVMGLAPYGEPRYSNLILERLLHLHEDGSFWIDQSYFDYCSGLQMTNCRFHDLFSGPPRQPSVPLSQRHLDLAASIQEVLNDAVVRLVRVLVSETGQRNLCLAGGVALNCVTNSRILQTGCIDRLWIPPAPGDAGAALGAALAAYHLYLRQPRHVTDGMDSMHGAYLGPAFSQQQIEDRLEQAGAVYSVLGEDELLDRCVDLLTTEKGLGWFQGRMEFGPRALGARSILADPRSPTMQSTLNLKIKNRESFRPFAPSVLAQQASSWFHVDTDSPYMLLLADVHADHRHSLTPEQQLAQGLDKARVVRSDIPAVTHVDYSARIHTVDAGRNPLYFRLLHRFYQRTGCPVLLNTSFNVRGEPIVCTPEDAFACFMATELDALAIGNCFLTKQEQTRARELFRCTWAED
jgi:carbamoyltransferase